MIQKTILILLFCSVLVSCGKKGDPVYVDPDKKVQKLYTLNVIT